MSAHQTESLPPGTERFLALKCQRRCKLALRGTALRFG
jgi:hypothetical protein